LRRTAQQPPAVQLVKLACTDCGEHYEGHPGDTVCYPCWKKFNGMTLEELIGTTQQQVDDTVATRTGTTKSRVAPSAEVADPTPQPCVDSQPQIIQGVAEQFGQYIVYGVPGRYGWLPEDHERQHNCDAMACGQDHALARFPIPERAAQPSGAGQIAWLVERQENGRAVWYTSNFHWTTDANEAMWFVRKLDAELFCWNTEIEAKAVEHMFCSEPASQTKEASHAD
jgi:hypothetical protein